MESVISSYYWQASLAISHFCRNEVLKEISHEEKTYQLGLLAGLLANMSQLLLQRAFLLVQLLQGLLDLLTLSL